MELNFGTINMASDVVVQRESQYSEISESTLTAIAYRPGANRFIDSTEYKVYKRRWYILLVVCVLNVSNAMIWITFSPIANHTAAFYNVDSMNVDWLSLVFLIASIPFGFCATWLIDTLGLRTSILLGAWINCVGSVLRVVSGLNDVPDYTRYPLVIAGQSLSAIAQPFVMFLPTKLAALWFKENQRATANMIASMSNPLGIMVASFLGPLIAKNKDEIPLVLNYYTIPAAVVTVMATFGVWSSVPPSPPTASAAEASEPFFKGLNRIVRNRSYWVLFFCFGAGLGIFTALTTLLEQILCPRGYTNNFAGLCGALMIGGGIIGAAIAGVFVDKTKKFEEVAKISFAMAALAGVAFTEVSRLPDQAVLVAVSITLFGMFGFALYPVCMELAVECTFPVAEATSSGFLIISGQIQGIVYILVMSLVAQPMSTSSSTCGTSVVTPQDFTVPNLFGSGISCLFACILMLFFTAEYRRMKAEQKIIAEKILNFSSGRSSRVEY